MYYDSWNVVLVLKGIVSVSGNGALFLKSFFFL